jgi:predicted Zn-dependent protease
MSQPDPFVTPSQSPAPDAVPKRGRRLSGAVIAVLASVLLIVILIQIRNVAVYGLFPPGAGGTGHPPSTLAESIDAAHVYLRKGDPGKAEAILRQAVEEHPEEQDLRVVYGETLMALKKYPEAYDQYVKALAIGPREAGTEFTAGTLANQTGHPDLALEHYSAAQRADPKSAQYPLYLGQIQLKLGEIEAGKVSLLRATYLDPESAVAWGTLADVAIRENKIDIALQHVARARQLQPEVSAWRVIEAKALKRQGNAEGALVLLQGLNPSERRDPNILRLIGESYGLLQRPAGAAAAYAEASDDSIGDAELAYEAAVWFQKAGDVGRALSYAKRASALGHEGAGKLVEVLKG